MFQKLFNLTVSVMVLACFLGITMSATAGSLQKIGKLETVLDIVAWPGYIERGDTDPAFDWVTGFEKKYNCIY